MVRKVTKWIWNKLQVPVYTIVFAGLLAVAWQLHEMPSTPRAKAETHMTYEEWVEQEAAYLKTTPEFQEYVNGQAEDLVRVKLQGDNDSALNASIQEDLHATDKYQQ
jgi:hypothetical protein